MIEQLAVVTRWFSLALLIAATVLYAYQLLMKRETLAWWARFLAGAGTLMLTAGIGFRSTVSNGTELVGPHNTLVLSAWAVLVVYFIAEHFMKNRTYGAVLVPVAVLLLIVAQFLSGAQPSGLTAAALVQLDNWRVGIHVVLIVFANAGFFVAGAASLFYLILGGQLKRHKTGPLLDRLPSLAQAQMIARRAVVLAFPAYTAGMILGTIRAIETDVGGFWADPRVMLSGLVWALFGTYLFLLYGRGVSGRTASWIAIAGAGAVVALSILARTLPVGFHIFAL